QAGQRVLDVGCGTGDDTRRLAGLVAPSGQAVGVDGWSLGHISNVTGISRPRLHRMLMNKET
ncbi:MAG: methyltransferase domain-containing protein, partial [Acidimicrobiia bacterium]